MTRLQSWFDSLPQASFAPLFETQGELQVQTHQRGQEGNRRMLSRSPGFDAAMIELVEQGLIQESWRGLIYVMGIGERQAFTPLYVGKTERRGTLHQVSHNIANIRGNSGTVARWGYGLDYHMGDLSHALFGFEAYRKPTPKYQRWAEVLFTSVDPPVLR